MRSGYDSRDIDGAVRRRLIKRFLRLAGVNVPPEAMYDEAALVSIEKDFRDSAGRAFEMAVQRNLFAEHEGRA